VEETFFFSCLPVGVLSDSIYIAAASKSGEKRVREMTHAQSTHTQHKGGVSSLLCCRSAPVTFIARIFLARKNTRLITQSGEALIAVCLRENARFVFFSLMESLENY
jgi:hypothetical protein